MFTCPISMFTIDSLLSTFPSSEGFLPSHLISSKPRSQAEVACLCLNYFFFVGMVFFHLVFLQSVQTIPLLTFHLSIHHTYCLLSFRLEPLTMPSRHPRSSSWAQGLSLEQFLEECVRRRQCGELSQAEIELIFTVLYPIARYNRERLNPKWSQALELIRHKPQDWFREQPIDDRDRALLNARPMSCFDLGKKSFLKKMVSPKASCLITEEPEEAEPPSLQLTSFQSHKVVDEEFKIVRGQIDCAYEFREPRFDVSRC